MSLRATVNRLLAPAQEGDRQSLFVDRLIFGVVIADLVLFMFIAEFPAGVPIQETGLYPLEISIIALFAIEYCLRLWSCVEDSRYRAPLGSRLRYARSPLAIVDLLAALPVLTLMPGSEAMIPTALTTVRTVRLLRLLRAVKLVRYSRSLRAFGRALRRIDEELVAVLFVVLLVAMVGATLAHSFEGDTQPDTFGNFSESVWWAIVTMTTVGYGDAVPITLGGRVVAGMLSVAGLAMFAAPAGLLAAAFGDEMARERHRRERQRDRERREREERQLEELVEAAVRDALEDGDHGQEVEQRVRESARRAVERCPQCGFLIDSRNHERH